MSYIEILPNIWLCDFETANDKNFILEHSIKIIFNCTKNLPFINIPNIKQYRLSVNDSGCDTDIKDMTEGLPKMIYLLNIAYSYNIPTIVFCYKGRQRSATLIAAYIIHTTGISWTNAIKMIQTKSPLTFKPQINFAKSLTDYSKKYIN
jgi:hypothetical protein